MKYDTVTRKLKKATEAISIAADMLGGIRPGTMCLSDFDYICECKKNLEEKKETLKMIMKGENMV